VNKKILNWQRPLWEGDQEVAKRSGREELICVVTHICLEIAQGNFLCSYFHLKLAKTLCFSFHLLCFFFNKIGEQEGRTDSALGWRGRLGEGSPNNVYTCK
jgi:hypothetical protein